MVVRDKEAMPRHHLAVPSPHCYVVAPALFLPPPPAGAKTPSHTPSCTPHLLPCRWHCHLTWPQASEASPQVAPPAALSVSPSGTAAGALDVAPPLPRAASRLMHTQRASLNAPPRKSCLPLRCQHHPLVQLQAFSTTPRYCFAQSVFLHTWYALCFLLIASCALGALLASYILGMS